MKKVKAFLMNFAKDESGQGTAEYVLILVAVVALAVAVGPRISKMIQAKMGDVEGQVSSFSGQ
jgi:Flp pilus assembly pilin Flp